MSPQPQAGGQNGQNPPQNPPQNGGNGQNPPQNPPQNGGNGQNPPQNPPQNGGNGQTPAQTTPGPTAPAQSQNSSSTSTTLSIPQSAPAGVISITQPPQTAVSFYKIAQDQLITFAWSASGILATPTHLTVSAVGDNGNTYPVGPTDGIIPGTATQVVWDVFSYQQNNPNTPLAQGSYTLVIQDERGTNAPRAPGFLQANSGLKFALYTPQTYTGLADGWTCTNCGANGAFSFAAGHPAIVGVFATFLVILLSGFNILRHAPGMR